MSWTLGPQPRPLDPQPRPLELQPWPLDLQPRPLSSDDGEWSSGICDCFQDVRECCFVCWCCPCFACMTSKALGQCLCLPLLEICGGCINPITMSMRVSMRHRYGIQGSLCSDCACSTFCLPCVWCQISREMKSRQLPTMLSDIISR